MTSTTKSAGGTSPRVLVATSDRGLLDDLLRLAAAAGVEVEVAADAGAARRSWARAAGVVVGDDLGPDLLLRPPARREGVILLGIDQDDATIWRRGVDLGVGHVVFLPDAEPWLLGWLADRGDQRRGPLGVGQVVGVVGGRGGAGASTFAVALARASVRAGAETMLIDADPLGGGLDLLLGLEGVEGLRWPDLAGAQGRMSTTTLGSTLLSEDGLGVLAWARDDLVQIEPPAIESVLAAAARGHDVVVVDLPRSLDPAAGLAAARCSVIYLLVPAEVRAVSSAARVANSFRAVAPQLEVVVRGPAPGGLAGEDIADALGWPLAGSMKAEPGLALCLERGEAPGGRRRSPLARLSDRLMAELLRTEHPNEAA